MSTIDAYWKLIEVAKERLDELECEREEAKAEAVRQRINFAAMKDNWTRTIAAEYKICKTLRNEEKARDEAERRRLEDAKYLSRMLATRGKKKSKRLLSTTRILINRPRTIRVQPRPLPLQPRYLSKRSMQDGNSSWSVVKYQWWKDVICTSMEGRLREQ